MNEDFLAFVWQYQYVNPAQLITSTGEKIVVIKTGNRNYDAGPDFGGCRLLLDDLEWAGCVEVHFRSSEWLQHQHQSDPVYESVILHIVWEDDRPARHPNGDLIPTLILKGKVSESIREKYELLLQQTNPILCSKMFQTTPEIYKVNMQEKLLLERLERKSQEMLKLLTKNKNDWEETTYQALLRYYGGLVNVEAFSRLAEVLPWKLLRKHRGHLLQTEALLFGCAGLLNVNSQDEYILKLQQEYLYLSKKYCLQDKQMAYYEWKFLRIRPAAFPTVRLAQLAAFLYKQPTLFSFFKTAASLDDLLKELKSHQSDYWQRHFVIGQQSKSIIPAMGSKTAELLVINVVIPLLVAYNIHLGIREIVPEKVWQWLEIIPAEKNSVLRIWQNLGVKITNASDSQAFLEWYTRYCQKKKCLSCSVGTYILRN